MATKTRIAQEFTTFQGRTFTVTCYEIKGRQPGPVLTLIAGQHGMEHIGPIALTQFIDEIESADFSGTLYICPCANPLALEMDYEFYPEKEDLSKIETYFYSRARHYHCAFGLDRYSEQGAREDNFYNMNRLWNRDGDYGVAGEITRWLWRETCQQADAIIDLHCLQAKKPLIFCSYPQSIPLASLFGVEAIYQGDPSKTSDFRKGGLPIQGNIHGKRAFTVEFSIQHALKEEEYAICKSGVRNTMVALGMLDGDIILPKPVYVIKQEDVRTLTTDQVGHIHYTFEEYAPVEQGDILFDIRDLETLEVVDRVESPVTGIMGQRTYRPISKPGEEVCRAAEATVVSEAGVALPGLEPLPQSVS